MKTFLSIALLSLGLAPALLAQETAAAPPATAAAPAPSPDALQDSIHNEIRAIRDEILAAIAKGDFDAIVPHLHPNVVFTPMNNEVCRGPQEVRDYFNRMLKGPDAVLKSVQFDMKVDRLTDLYGDTGLAFGDSDAVYTLKNGTELPVTTRWTCALVRHEGRFKIAAFQASPNAFDNTILLQKTRAASFKGGGIGAVVGLLVGMILAIPLRSRMKK
jgi:ketosteroid isomerase-like protein